MADEQTGDFFMPPADDLPAFAAPAFAADDLPAFAADDLPAFAAPATGGEDSQIGDVYYGTAGDGDFFPPQGEPAAAGDVLLGESAPYEAPPAVAEGDVMLGFAAPGVVEDVADEEEDEVAVPLALVPAAPTAMALWNEEWQATLLRRKDEENATKAGHVEAARAEIAAFQAERERKRESRMAKNRSDEQDKLEAIEADLENDNSYQRVVKMIELNQDSVDGAADTGRMKDVLVLLKNEPARADALSA